MPLTFISPNCFSKWGNSDGDCPEWAYELFEGGRWDGDWHQVLYALASDFLAPQMPEAEFMFMNTCHNPVRIRTWRGFEEYDIIPEYPPEGFPRFDVTIPDETVKEYMLKFGNVTEL